MRWFRFLPGLLLVSLGATAAHGVEITLAGGYRDGEVAYAQSIVCAASVQAPCPTDIAADAGATFGLILDHELGGGWGFEALLSWQESELGLADNPSTLPVEPFLFGETTLTTTHLQVGAIYRRAGERFSPFAAATVGLAHLTTSDPSFLLVARPEGEHPSASFGLGLRIAIARHVGLRLEGRGWWTDLPRSVGGDLYQADATAGVSFRW